MTTLGVIVGNRGFFPKHLCVTGRQTILKVLEKAAIKVVITPEESTNYGAVESLEEAYFCADYFKKYREEIDGILVTLPNFGDEKAIANTIRFSELNVPVLVHAFEDEVSKMTIKDRRDSFCGKMSVCNNLRQYGIQYSLTTLHTVHPESDSFKVDLGKFATICNITKHLKGARVGIIGARPAAFNTVRFSEKLLEHSGISVETLDLSELLGWVKKLDTNEPRVKEKISSIKEYTQVQGIPESSVEKMAKLGVSIDEWVLKNKLNATAIQCWTAMEEFYGVVPCTLMSMMSSNLVPSACETDITGLIGMYILQSASGKASAIVDWNNNYANDPNKGVLFHCSNLPKDVFDSQKMDYNDILAGILGKEITYGTIVGRMKQGAFTYCRISTDDIDGAIASYVGEGRLTGDPLTTFGGFGVFEIPNLQKLLAYICENGFEHHVAVNLSKNAEAVYEALSKYMKWKVYFHQG